MTSAEQRSTVFDRAFFRQDSTEVAPRLLGGLLRRIDLGITVRIIETEAYLAHEPACHAFRGLTPGNRVLFGPPGHAYVYFTYGMHWLPNVVTGEDGDGQGVLLRAAEPVEGLAAIRANRGPRVRDRDLLRGPARLGQALGLDGQWSGCDLLSREATLRLQPGDPVDGRRVAHGPRVGVRHAADLPWRFWLADSRSVSVYKRHPRAE